MNHNIELGVTNSLIIGRGTDNGFYLQDKEGEEVLLPNSYITEDMKIGDMVDVFVYTDSEDRIVATTEKPLCQKDDFAYLEVVDECSFGAFVDIGLPKDILVPTKKQIKPFRVGEKRVIKLIEDEYTNRLVAVEKFDRLFERETRDLSISQEVEIIVFAKSDLGYKVAVNNRYEGLVFKNEVFQNINIGDTLKAYIKNIRRDGKLDIILQPFGKDRTEDNSQKVLSVLKDNGGFMPYNYKSDSNDIYATFGLSKKAYKKALTTLQNSEEISIDEKGISLR
jgi:predicted RNA-binding protein (virulence factor B family)